MDKFLGKWKLESSEHFEQYLEATGVPAPARKMLTTANPEFLIGKIGENKWVAHTIGLPLSKEFELGKPFEFAPPDGRKLKITFHMDGPNKLVEDQEGGPVKAHNVSEISPDGNTITIVLTALAEKPVVATRHMKRCG